MKITLLDVQGYKKHHIYKDFAGGLGTRFCVGSSPFSRMLEFAKRNGLVLPIPFQGYLSAIFRKNGHTVEFAKNIIPDSDLVIIHSSIVDCWSEIDFARRIKGQTRAKVGFIGNFSALQPELYLKQGDFVIVGEPESIAEGISPDWIPSGVLQGDPRNLDELPFPNYDGYWVERCSYYPSIRKKPVLPVLSSRGCSFGCAYCAYLVNSNFRYRTPKNVVDEIEYLADRYHIKGFLFRDPLFTAKKERSREIAKGLIARKIQLEWGCETRLDQLNSNLIDDLYESGLRTIEVGVESAVDGILLQKNVSRKPDNVHHQEEIIEHCKKKGINITAFYILGLPNETEETMQTTIDYARKLDTNVASFSVCTPHPGTRFFESVKEQILTDDWEKFTMYNPVHKHENLTAEQILRYKEKAYFSYYFRPKYAVKFFKMLLT